MSHYRSGIIILLGAFLACTASMQAQLPGPGPASDSLGRRGHDTLDSAAAGARPWYDSLAVTQPRYATITKYERLALAAYMAVAIPVGIVIGVTTILPPSINVLHENGTSHTGFAWSTGFSLVHDTTAYIFFPDYRVQLEGAYFLRRRPAGLFRTSVNFDLPIASVSHHDVFWFGIAGGAGLSTDFTSASPYAEGWVGLINPMGIRFLTLFPMHHYGLRGRIGYDPATRAAWYELSLAATSTFWF